jgi:hypothetical protein
MSIWIIKANSSYTAGESIRLSNVLWIEPPTDLAPAQIRHEQAIHYSHLDKPDAGVHCLFDLFAQSIEIG